MTVTNNINVIDEKKGAYFIEWKFQESSLFGHTFKVINSKGNNQTIYSSRFSLFYTYNLEEENKIVAKGSTLKFPGIDKEITVTTYKTIGVEKGQSKTVRDSSVLNHFFCIYDNNNEIIATISQVSQEILNGVNIGINIYSANDTLLAKANLSKQAKNITFVSPKDASKKIFTCEKIGNNQPWKVMVHQELLNPNIAIFLAIAMYHAPFFNH